MHLRWLHRGTAAGMPQRPCAQYASLSTLPFLEHVIWWGKPILAINSSCLQSFFTRWWREQTTATKELVQKLVHKGQLDFVNGGYVQHDEAAAHYVAMIDQTTRGHRFDS